MSRRKDSSFQFFSRHRHLHVYRAIFTYLLFALLFVLDTTKSGIQADSFHVYKNRLYYYNGAREMGLNETEELCEQLGGQLPSVHGQEDTNFLFRLIGRTARVWLGGEKITSEPGVPPNKTYAWIDGTPMDYFPFVNDHDICKASCCGIGYTTVVSPGLVIKECTSKRRMVCALTSVTQSFENEILNNNSSLNPSSQNSSSAAFQAMKILSTLNFDLLNETLNRAKEEAGGGDSRRVFDNEKLTEMTRKFAILENDTRASLSQLQSRVEDTRNSLTQNINLLTVELNKEKIALKAAMNSLNQSLIQNSKQVFARVSGIEVREESDFRVMTESVSHHSHAIIGLIVLLMSLGLLFYFRDNVAKTLSGMTSYITYLSAGGRRKPSGGLLRGSSGQHRLRDQHEGDEDKDVVFQTNTV